MFVELAKKLKDTDSIFKLSIYLSKDGVYTLSVDAIDFDGEYYSYSSTSILECYEKIWNFIEALGDTDKFNELINDILNIPMEV
jgi:hypothetical protein